MEEQKIPNPRRRKRRNPIETFKEQYLPAIIICVAFILILVFTIGSITRAIQHKKADALQKEQVRLSQQQALEELEKEVADLIKEAEAYAKDYDYVKAVETLDRFSGDLSKFPQMTDLRKQYEEAKQTMVLWEDNSKVLNLSFQLLIADPERAFRDETYGVSYKNNFVTTTEFANILQQLYENDYILISLDDIYHMETDELGQTYLSSKELYLPQGKKPVMITQTQVNYNTYMIDGDGDKLPDKDGDGFASKLIIDANGNLTCEMVNSDGSVTTGAYDLVPILDSFVETHEDFSYKGAKAVLAVTGYDGLFGYRTTTAAGDIFGDDKRQEEIDQAIAVIQKLRETGYDIACYTYENIGYGDSEIDAIDADLSGWTNEVMPILQDVNIFVFAKSDIANASAIYSGEKYNKLAALGFKYFIGFCENGTPWQMITDSYVRQGRLMVTGNNLANNPAWFDGIFQVDAILDSNRT